MLLDISCIVLSITSQQHLMATAKFKLHLFAAIVAKPSIRQKRTRCIQQQLSDAKSMLVNYAGRELPFLTGCALWKFTSMLRTSSLQKTCYIAKVGCSVILTIQQRFLWCFPSSFAGAREKGHIWRIYFTILLLSYKQDVDRSWLSTESTATPASPQNETRVERSSNAHSIIYHPSSSSKGKVQTRTHCKLYHRIEYNLNESSTLSLAFLALYIAMLRDVSSAWQRTSPP